SEDDYAQMKSAVMEVVGQHFRPEFLNRVDDMVVFHPLGEEEIRRIVTIQLRYLQQRLGERDMSLTLSGAAVARLAQAGFDPVYGARPLKRAIQRELENPLAQQILAGNLGPGDHVGVDIGEQGDSLTFVRELPSESA
ncbi:MAG: type VI secretion system ATPase TssH, partial [Pseudomonadota bacterium]